MSDITQHTDYRQAIAAIKQRIQASQTRAVLAVNAELLGLYWDIGDHAATQQSRHEFRDFALDQRRIDGFRNVPELQAIQRDFAVRTVHCDHCQRSFVDLHVRRNGKKLNPGLEG